MTSLAEQTVLVTGANRGMGREYIGQLLNRGATKVYAAARDPRTIDDSNPRVSALALDVTDTSSIRAAGSAAPAVGVLINNAGILCGSSTLDPDTSGLREELETNLYGPLAMASTFANRIAERAGAIVNVASVLAWWPVGASYAYLETERKEAAAPPAPGGASSPGPDSPLGGWCFSRGGDSLIAAARVE